MKKELKDKLKEFKAIRGRIADERDKLRSIFSEIEDNLEALDQADNSLHEGIRYIEDGLDELSQYL